MQGSLTDLRLPSSPFENIRYQQSRTAKTAMLICAERFFGCVHPGLSSQPKRKRMNNMTAFSVNGKQVNLDVDPSTPLLWVIRDHLGLTGTKYGCGMAQCGACTVHIDGEAVRSCVAPVSRASGKAVTTIEGLSSDLSHPLQRAWLEEDVPQCGLLPIGTADERRCASAPEAAAHR